MQAEIRAQKRLYAERVKELECLYGVARLFNQPGRTGRTTLIRLASMIRSAWQYPGKTGVRILVGAEEVRTEGCKETPWKLHSPIALRGKRCGSIDIYWLGARPADGEPFLPAEHKLLRAIAELTENMLLRRETEREMRRASASLRDQTSQLERKNIALQEVLGRIEIEKAEIRERVAADINAIAMPVLHKLKAEDLSSDQRARYLGIMESSLKDISSGTSRMVISRRSRLSPREIEIADLVRSRASTKEIARLLHLSEATVERHRHNVRKKLGIAGAKANLGTYLLEV